MATENYRRARGATTSPKREKSAPAAERKPYPWPAGSKVTIQTQRQKQDSQQKAKRAAAAIKPVEVTSKKTFAPVNVTSKRTSADGAVATKKTAGGSYPVYRKNSATASDFRSAFAAARKAGKKTFEWKGRSYTTEVKK